MSLDTSPALAAQLQRSQREVLKLNPKSKKGRKFDPFIIAPMPDLKELKEGGAASVNIRLGTWFMAFRQGRLSLLDVKKLDQPDESMMQTKMHYVPFGGYFVLHPRSFVLGVTLEWLRMPNNRAGYVTSRSSWGRRGLIIATASGVHPGFSGCLTLELTNVGEAPIALYPGTDICQFFIHSARKVREMDKSRFVGKRKPSLGDVAFDDFAKALARYGSGARLPEPGPNAGGEAAPGAVSV